MLDVLLSILVNSTTLRELVRSVDERNALNTLTQDIDLEGTGLSDTDPTEAIMCRYIQFVLCTQWVHDD